MEEEIKKTDEKKRGKTLLELFLANKLDALLLFLSVAVAVITAYVGSRPVDMGRDPGARMNAIFLGLLVISWLVGLCKGIQVRAWGTLLSAVGLALLLIDMAGQPGGAWQGIRDAFRL
ncbi:TPA: hypothetical protein QEK28_003532 [Stenotrophomonas maltophilia]|nr:hypothetical protein [Stenotrophomonas maltophilia]